GLERRKHPHVDKGPESFERFDLLNLLRIACVERNADGCCRLFYRERRSHDGKPSIGGATLHGAHVHRVETSRGVLTIPEPRTSTSALPKGTASSLPEGVARRARLSALTLNQNIGDRTSLRDRDELQLLSAIGCPTVHIVAPR